MMRVKYGTLLPGLIMLTLACCNCKAQQPSSAVTVVGDMKNVMWKGQLHGNINLDTIATRTNLYGLGPVEYLTGEALIIDGRSYKSSVVSDSTMNVEEPYDIKAPFFGYAQITKWVAQNVPDSIQTMLQLETYLDKVTENSPRPFLFKIMATVEQATIHIVNLPKGSEVSSPDDAHRGQKKYYLKNVQSEGIGFFSTEHKAIFTHHSTFLHMHLITSDRKAMAHLDEVLFKAGTLTLYLPGE